MCEGETVRMFADIERYKYNKKHSESANPRRAYFEERETIGVKQSSQLCFVRVMSDIPGRFQKNIFTLRNVANEHGSGKQKNTTYIPGVKRNVP